MLLGVSRSSLYYRPKGEGAENLALMWRMDELHMEYPFYGNRQMMRHHRRGGVAVGRHRIRRLMRLMGLRRPTGGRGRARRTRSTGSSPICCATSTTSKADPVWCADITYVPVTQGVFYLVAVMDRATRHVLA